MTCKHRWRLEECDGRALVSGVCAYCGAVRDDFQSSIEYSAQRGDDLHMRFFSNDPRSKRWW